jgi:hypothetical protein
MDIKMASKQAAENVLKTSEQFDPPDQALFLSAVISELRSKRDEGFVMGDS